MRRSRFSEAQIIGILREQEGGAATAEVCRRHGVSQATFYKGKAKFGGLELSETQRLRALGGERQADAAAGRRDAGQRGAEGHCRKKKW